MPIINHQTIEDAEVFDGVFSRQLVNKKLGGSASVTVGELKIKPGCTLPDHIHFVEEALIVVHGKGKAYLDDEALYFEADMTILIPTGKKHKITNTGTEMLKIFYTFPAVEVDRVLI